MTAADRVVERAATRLSETAGRWSGESGWKAKLAEPLADDAVFLRKLKPSLVVARARGRLPTDERPSQSRTAPSAPLLGERPKPARADGPNPFLVVGAAFAVGIVLAKLIDWRSHAHPRD